MVSSSPGEVDFVDRETEIYFKTGFISSPGGTKASQMTRSSGSISSSPTRKNARPTAKVENTPEEFLERLFPDADSLYDHVVGQFLTGSRRERPIKTKMNQVGSTSATTTVAASTTSKPTELPEREEKKPKWATMKMQRNKKEDTVGGFVADDSGRKSKKSVQVDEQKNTTAVFAFYQKEEKEERNDGREINIRKRNRNSSKDNVKLSTSTTNNYRSSSPRTRNSLQSGTPVLRKMRAAVEVESERSSSDKNDEAEDEYDHDDILLRTTFMMRKKEPKATETGTTTPKRRASRKSGSRSASHKKKKSKKQDRKTSPRREGEDEDNYFFGRTRTDHHLLREDAYFYAAGSPDAVKRKPKEEKRKKSGSSARKDNEVDSSRVEKKSSSSRSPSRKKRDVETSRNNKKHSHENFSDREMKKKKKSKSREDDERSRKTRTPGQEKKERGTILIKHAGDGANININNNMKDERKNSGREQVFASTKKTLRFQEGAHEAALFSPPGRSVDQQQMNVRLFGREEQDSSSVVFAEASELAFLLDRTQYLQRELLDTLALLLQSCGSSFVESVVGRRGKLPAHLQGVQRENLQSGLPTSRGNMASRESTTNRSGTTGTTSQASIISVDEQAQAKNFLFVPEARPGKAKAKAKAPTPSGSAGAKKKASSAVVAPESTTTKIMTSKQELKSEVNKPFPKPNSRTPSPAGAQAKTKSKSPPPAIPAKVKSPPGVVVLPSSQKAKGRPAAPVTTTPPRPASNKAKQKGAATKSAKSPSLVTAKSGGGIENATTATAGGVASVNKAASKTQLQAASAAPVDGGAGATQSSSGGVFPKSSRSDVLDDQVSKQPAVDVEQEPVELTPLIAAEFFSSSSDEFHLDHDVARRAPADDVLVAGTPSKSFISADVPDSKTKAKAPAGNKVEQETRTVGGESRSTSRSLAAGSGGTTTTSTTSRVRFLKQGREGEGSAGNRISASSSSSSSSGSSAASSSSSSSSLHEKSFRLFLEKKRKQEGVPETQTQVEEFSAVEGHPLDVERTPVVVTRTSAASLERDLSTLVSTPNAALAFLTAHNPEFFAKVGRVRENVDKAKANLIAVASRASPALFADELLIDPATSIPDDASHEATLRKRFLEEEGTRGNNRSSKRGQSAAGSGSRTRTGTSNSGGKNRRLFGFASDVDLPEDQEDERGVGKTLFGHSSWMLNLGRYTDEIRRDELLETTSPPRGVLKKRNTTSGQEEQEELVSGGTMPALGPREEFSSEEVFQAQHQQSELQMAGSPEQSVETATRTRNFYTKPNATASALSLLPPKKAPDRFTRLHLDGFRRDRMLQEARERKLQAELLQEKKFETIRLARSSNVLAASEGRGSQKRLKLENLIERCSVWEKRRARWRDAKRVEKEAQEEKSCSFAPRPLSRKSEELLNNSGKQTWAQRNSAAVRKFMDRQLQVGEVLQAARDLQEEKETKEAFAAGQEEILKLRNASLYSGTGGRGGTTVQELPPPEGGEEAEKDGSTSPANVTNGATQDQESRILVPHDRGISSKNAMSPAALHRAFRRIQQPLKRSAEVTSRQELHRNDDYELTFQPKTRAGRYFYTRRGEGDEDQEHVGSAAEVLPIFERLMYDHLDDLQLSTLDVLADADADLED